MKITSKKFLRLAVLGGVFLLSFASPISTRDLQAQIGKQGNEFDYYSDDTYSELVGYRIYCNSGQSFSYGTQPVRDHFTCRLLRLPRQKARAKEAMG